MSLDGVIDEPRWTFGYGFPPARPLSWWTPGPSAPASSTSPTGRR